MKCNLVAAAALAVPLFAAGLVVAACGTYQGASPAGADSSVPVETATIAASTIPTTTESVTEPTPLTADPEPEEGGYFGYIKSVDLGAKPATLTFDLAIHLGGEEANREAERRGYETPVSNDYFIVNDDPKLWTLPLADDLELRILDWSNCCAAHFAGDLVEFAASFQREHPLRDGNYKGATSAYDLTVRDGVVVAVHERYFP